VLFHFGQKTAPFSQDWLLPLVQQAGLGVGFFFTLSGFLLAWVYAPQPKIDLKRYAQTRFARIYPLYLLTFLLALAAMMIVRDARPRGLSIILQSVGLHAWVPGYSLTLNFPGWSVSVELFFYLVFPWLLYGLRKQHGAVLWGIAAIASALGLLVVLKLGIWTEGIVPNENSDFVMRFPPWHLHSFIVGMVGGILYGRGKLRIPTKWLPSVLFVALSAGMVSLAYFPNWIIDHAGNGLLAPVYLCMILSLAQDKGPISKVFSWKPMEFAGEMSYAVYLLQAPVYIALEPLALRAGAPGLHGTWLWIYLGVLLLCSAVVYQFFERPMRNWLRPKTATKPA
jgi:peptidoglycan/LPS O-acetylase OafA/YrhL